MSKNRRSVGYKKISWNGALISNFRDFFAGIGKIFILAVGGVDAYWGIILWSLDTFLIFPKAGNSWGYPYIPCLQVIIAHGFTCGERKIWSNIKVSKYYENDCRLICLDKNFIRVFVLTSVLSMVFNTIRRPYAIWCQWHFLL